MLDRPLSNHFSIYSNGLDAIVSRIEGKVEIATVRNNRAENRVPAKVGDMVGPKQIIQTSSTARCELIWNNTVRRTETETNIADIYKRNWISNRWVSTELYDYSIDGIIRIGPSSVFSCEPKGRILSLDKGELLFYLEPGNGRTKPVGGFADYGSP